MAQIKGGRFLDRTTEDEALPLLPVFAHHQHTTWDYCEPCVGYTDHALTGRRAARKSRSEGRRYSNYIYRMPDGSRAFIVYEQQCTRCQRISWNQRVTRQHFTAAFGAVEAANPIVRAIMAPYLDAERAWAEEHRLRNIEPDIMLLYDDIEVAV